MLKVKAGKIAKGDPKFKITKKEIDRISRLLFGKLSLAVGLPSDSLPYPDGTSVVLVGFWAEFGTKFAPERSFLRTGLDEKREEWLKFARQLYAKAIRENRDPEVLLRLLGEQMQIGIQSKIDTGPFEENAEPYKSIKAKTGKTKPLIVTGHMRGSIRYVMEKKR